ncbi:MAG: HD domain-containing protein [Candidatus Cloacimonetes bacterium]|nr:HD domain-containing protein [Candidatus Cloacimonadota bacterium]
MSIIISETELQAIRDYIKKKFNKDATGHDWEHIFRVVRIALQIHQVEGGDAKLVEAIALLHDLGDWKFNEESQDVILDKFLKGLGLEDDLIQVLVTQASGISYKGAQVKTPTLSLEGQIVQDADRMDAIGALGIARCFAYGGSKDRSIFDDQVEWISHETAESYKNCENPSLHHFYEKLLLLKDMMNTKEGSRLAKQRHDYMVAYLEQFFMEWYGSVENAPKSFQLESYKD